MSEVLQNIQRRDLIRVKIIKKKNRKNIKNILTEKRIYAILCKYENKEEYPLSP